MTDKYAGRRFRPLRHNVNFTLQPVFFYSFLKETPGPALVFFPARDIFLPNIAYLKRTAT